MTLQQIFKPISKELLLVKEQLLLQLNRLYDDENVRYYQKAHIERFIKHFFNVSGKGLRPALVLLSAKLVGPVNAGESSYHSLIKLATVVELIHSASLTHDDVVDHAQYRRNQVSLNEKYGNGVAVLVGDILFLQAFSLLLNLENVDGQKKEQILQIVYRTAQKMCLGEMCEHHVITERRPAELDEYLVILENKTAILMSACCQCGAILTGKDPMISKNLANFGLHFGLAFQLADDLKDKDSLLHDNVDLLPITQNYIKQAKEDLRSANGNSVTKNLMALCDILLPGDSSSGIFDQKNALL
jgi:geranylgeranyl pyrophosphate synthase